MLPKRDRLTRAELGGRQTGKRYSSEHLSAFFLDSSKKSAVVIAKKTLKSAVERRRLKRKLMGTLVHMPAAKGVVLYPKASALKLPAKQLAAELAALTAKAGRA